MSIEICPVCVKVVTKGLSFKHKKCNHRLHGHCMDLDQEEPNFDTCAHCLGASTTDITHPSTFEGRDYIENPASSSLFSSIRGLVTRKTSILDKQLPLDHLIAQHGYGLQRLLSEGTCFNDFIGNGYTYEDLQLYPSIQNKQIKTLVALRCDASHFRSGKIPMDGITPKILIENFGLYFPPNCQPLNAFGQEPWSAHELVKLGFKIGDLFGAELEYFEQYQDLNPQDEDEIAMGVTDADIEQLPFYNHKNVILVKEQPVVQPRTHYVEREPVQIPIIQHKPRIKRYHGLRKK